MTKKPPLKISRSVEIWPNKTLLISGGEVHWRKDWWIGKIELVSPGVAHAGVGTDLDSIRKVIELTQ